MTKKDITAQMRKLVKQFRDCGQSQKEFAASHGLTEGKLYYGVSKFTKQQQEVSPSMAPDKSFVPIALTSVEEQESRSIIIRCTNGVEIEILI